MLLGSLTLGPMEQFELLTPSDVYLCPYYDYNYLIFTNCALIILIILLFMYTIRLFIYFFKFYIFPSILTLFFIDIYQIIDQLILENINIYYYYEMLQFFLFTIFFFILLSNFSGTIPYTFTITAQLIITFSLSIFILFLVNSILIERYGIISLRFFLPSGAPMFIFPFLVIIEIISYSARVFSLGIRLFANMMSGHILLKIFSEFSFNLGIFLGLPLNILIICFYSLEVLIAALQAYVFLILSCIYFKEAIFLH